MKRALFIPVGFYDYDARIAQEIENHGYKVDTFSPIGDYTFWEKVRNTLRRGQFLGEKAEKVQRSYFGSNRNRYDLIFVIVGRDLKPELFQEFCERNSGARKVLYLWDSVNRVRNFHEIKACFDDIFSFDHVDVEEYGLQMHPLFFTDNHRYHGEEKKYCLGLMGTLYPERLALFDQITQAHGLTEKECFVYLMGTEYRHFLNWFNPFRMPWTGHKYVHLNGMSFEACADILKQMKIALDVQFGTQNGLTLRTMESLAAHTKLITTNQNVKHYDFYNENNICIIDKESPEVSGDFFNKEFEPIPDEILEKYSLTKWVERILG